MNVPFFDYRPAHARLRDALDRAVQRVLDSGRLILGPEVEAFESEFAAWIGVPHAVGVNSGTDALVLALRALGIGRGDEVITTANCGAPPVAAIAAVGAVPRLVDVRADTLLIDVERAAEAVGPRTRALLAVHLYGQPADLDGLLALARRHGLALVEDCAQAHGARHRDRVAGSVGDVGCFSFYPTKNLGAYGDGGAVVTRDAELARRVRLQRMYGFDGDRSSRVEGLNSRLDELQAAILRVKLPHLDADNRRRLELVRRYRRGLEGSSFSVPLTVAAVKHVYHLCVVLSPQRDSALRCLRDAGIGCGVHYPVPAHRMPAYTRLGLRDGDLPVSEDASRRVLSLPLYADLQPEQVDHVVQTLLHG